MIKPSTIEDAIELYERKIITAKGLILFYLETKEMMPHELEPRLAEIELGITSRCIYYKLREIQEDLRNTKQTF